MTCTYFVPEKAFFQFSKDVQAINLENKGLEQRLIAQNTLSGKLQPNLDQLLGQVMQGSNLNNIRDMDEHSATECNIII